MRGDWWELSWRSLLRVNQVLLCFYSSSLSHWFEFCFCLVESVTFSFDLMNAENCCGSNAYFLLNFAFGRFQR